MEGSRQCTCTRLRLWRGRRRTHEVHQWYGRVSAAGVGDGVGYGVGEVAVYVCVCVVSL